MPSFPDIRADDARALVSEFLTASPAAAGCRRTRPPTCCTATGSGWSTLIPAGSEDEAVAAAGAVSGPVVLKADVPGLVPKTDAGAVELDLRTAADVRAAYRRLADRFGRSSAGSWCSR